MHLPIILLAVVMATAEEVYVTVVHAPPFIIVGANDSVSGYLVDVWNKIAEKEHITTIFSVVVDGKYGVYDDASEKWSGLMGEVVGMEADVALAPLTITPKRMDHVAFTRPIMPAGIVMVTKRPESGQPQSFTDLMDLFSVEHPKVGVIGSGSSWQWFTHSKHPLYKAVGDELTANVDGPHQLVDAMDGVNKLYDNKLDVIFLEQYMAEFITEKEPCNMYIVGKTIGRREYGLAVTKTNTALVQRINRQLIEMQMYSEDADLRAKWWRSQCRSVRWCTCEAGVSSEESSREHRARPNNCKADGEE